MPAHGKLWSLVLAGGQGDQLRHIMSDVYGVDIPNQFCAFKGGETLLRRTVRRAMRLCTPETVVVGVSDRHRQWWEPQLADLPSENVVVHPCSRGTACGVLLPLLPVVLHDPQATVVVLPADHFVQDEEILLRAVRKAVKAARRWPDTIALLGVPPDGPDHDYGWIEPTLKSVAGVHWVLSFVEKPTPFEAENLWQRGALWSSFVFVAQGLTLLAAFEAAFPGLVRRFGAAWLARDERDGRERIVELYRNLPSLDLSRDLFAVRSESLRVVPVSPCGWTDLGAPDRVLRCLANEELQPPSDADRVDLRAAIPDLAFGVTAHHRRSGVTSGAA